MARELRVPFEVSLPAGFFIEDAARSTRGRWGLTAGANGPRLIRAASPGDEGDDHCRDRDQKMEQMENASHQRGILINDRGRVNDICPSMTMLGADGSQFLELLSKARGQNGEPAPGFRVEVLVIDMK